MKPPSAANSPETLVRDLELIQPETGADADRVPRRLIGESVPVLQGIRTHLEAPRRHPDLRDAFGIDAALMLPGPPLVEAGGASFLLRPVVVRFPRDEQQYHEHTDCESLLE